MIPLHGIITSIVKSKPEVDAKQVFLFFKDYKLSDSPVCQIQDILPIIHPDTVMIINQDKTYEDLKDTPAYKLLNDIKTILPKSKVTIINPEFKDGEMIIDHQKDDVSKLDVIAPTLGINVGEKGQLEIYRAPSMIQKFPFKIGDLSQEELETLRDMDIDVKYPTEGVYLLNEICNPGTTNLSVRYTFENFNETGDLLRKVIPILAMRTQKGTLHLSELKQDSEDWVFNTEGSTFLLYVTEHGIQVYTLRDGTVLSGNPMWHSEPIGKLYF